MSDATQLNDEDLRVFALDELARHTPANQEGNGYERCEHCHYTRHPCDVYDLAAGVLRLLDEIERVRIALNTTEHTRQELWDENVRLRKPLYAHDPETGLTTVVVKHDASFNDE